MKASFFPAVPDLRQGVWDELPPVPTEDNGHQDGVPIRQLQRRPRGLLWRMPEEPVRPGRPPSPQRPRLEVPPMHWEMQLLHLSNQGGKVRHRHPRDTSSRSRYYLPTYLVYCPFIIMVYLFATLLLKRRLPFLGHESVMHYLDSLKS